MDQLLLLGHEAWDHLDHLVEEYGGDGGEMMRVGLW